MPMAFQGAASVETRWRTFTAMTAVLLIAKAPGQGHLVTHGKEGMKNETNLHANGNDHEQ